MNTGPNVASFGAVHDPKRAFADQFCCTTEPRCDLTLVAPDDVEQAFVSRNEIYGMLAGGIGSLRLDISGLDHLAPFLGFRSDEFPELGGCHRHGANA
jgi:hypothetical protein